MSTGTRRARTTLLGAALATISVPAIADPSPALDRASLLLGVYYPDTKFSLSARDGDTSTGRLDLVRGHNAIGRFRLDLLAWDSQGLSFDYYRYSHASDHRLQRPFRVDGVPFVLDTDARARFDGSTASMAYRWWFGHDSDVAGFGLGATWLRATFSVAGTIQLDEISTSGSVSRTEEAVAPLVTLGYRHAFSDRLRIYLDASGVHKPSGRLTGHIYDARAGVEWFAWPNFGIGAEYGATQIELERHREPYSARLRLHLHGPSLFARLRF
ncbi:MAG: hypothetical protein GXC76_12155 [Rhodanobacteraceae bacterium]|jgi:hypothetical protein|nr:hypothetical protein [Rhodanobacteraceae bacterium]